MNKPGQAARGIARIIKGTPATDGAGVELTRVIGQPPLPMLDPFLLLDAFRSDKPEDYIAGFPAHPHRGFETVTYLLSGRMRHKDNAGHEGLIEPGGIQWMTAGKGIVHSEMPEQQDGLLEGFQLWINLPASHKMTTPAYQEYDQTQLPVENREGALVRVITGETTRGTRGPVSQPLTDPLYLDVSLEAGVEFSESINANHTAFLYVIEGEALLADSSDEQLELRRDQLAVLGQGDAMKLNAGDRGARFLLLAGKPLHEPVARGGPFVMNTADEVRQAFSDYQRGEF